MDQVQESTWPPGGGRAGDQIRAADWPETSMGTLADWPDALRTTLALILATPAPAVLLWGEDQVVFANDAYTDAFGDVAQGGALRTQAHVLLEMQCVAGVLAGQGGMLAWSGSTQIAYSPVPTDNGVGGVVAIITPAAQQPESAVRASEARQRFLLALNKALRPLNDPAAIQTTACRLLGEHLDANRVIYAEIDGSEFIVRTSYEHGVQQIAGRVPIPAFGALALKAYHLGEPIAVADVDADPRFSDHERASLRQLDIAALAGALLVKEERWVGVFAIHSAVPRDWSKEELALIDEVAQRIWMAVERTRAIEALRYSEARLQLALDSAHMGTFLWHVQEDRGEPDERMLALFGLAPTDTLTPRKALATLIHPQDRDAYATAISQAIDPAGDGTLHIDVRVVHSDGSERWLLITAKVLFADQPRKAVSMYGIVSDITGRKHAEAALRESEEHFRLLVEGARDYAMFLTDIDMCITFWSAGAERVFGWREHEVLGRDAKIIFTPEDRERNVPEHEKETALLHGSALDRRWHLCKDGTRIFIDGAMIRLNTDQGALRGFVKIGRNATVQRLAEEALQRTRDELEQRVWDRTAALNASNIALQDEIIQRREIEVERTALLKRLITVQEDERQRIARELHDSLGQILTALTIRIATTRSIATDQPRIVAALDQLRNITTQLDSELDRLTMELRPPTLDDLGLGEALHSYTAEWAEANAIRVDLLVHGLNQSRLPAAVETTVYRIVQEALTNTLKHAQANEVSIILERRGTTLRIIVEDNGRGFDLEASQRQRGGGRQLGLMSMTERATLVGGTLVIESAPQAGTTIYLTIPLFGDDIDIAAA